MRDDVNACLRLRGLKSSLFRNLMLLELAQASQVFILLLSRQWPCLAQCIAQNVFGLRIEAAQFVVGPALHGGQNIGVDT